MSQTPVVSITTRLICQLIDDYFTMFFSSKLEKNGKEKQLKFRQDILHIIGQYFNLESVEQDRSRECINVAR